MDTFKFEDGLKDTNRPTPILGTGETYSPCYTTDFAKVNDNREIFCCGCGDGGARLYNFNIKN